MGFDNAYEALSDAGEDHRWAFGTGFHAPLSGVERALPAGAEPADLVAYCLMLADDALVMSHRLQEWLASAPELEEETALANIGLDLLGQARLLYARAGEAEGAGRDEDAFALWRDEAEFRNVRLVEAPNADFATLVVRLFLFSTWRLAVLSRLRRSRDAVLAAIAEKGVKELTYHRDYAAEWVVRLGDGTALSHERAEAALAAVGPLAGELTQASGPEQRLAAAGVTVDPGEVRAEVEDVVDEVLLEATLRWPLEAAVPPPGAPPRGRDGAHTEAMHGILTEMQGLARAHPGARW
ncbi:MAG: 1,2-phenylacetyl-CoA epoxidase subunit PaaC [Acidimicrobiales bacterium]